MHGGVSVSVVLLVPAQCRPSGQMRRRLPALAVEHLGLLGFAQKLELGQFKRVVQKLVAHRRWSPKADGFLAPRLRCALLVDVREDAGQLGVRSACSNKPAHEAGAGRADHQHQHDVRCISRAANHAMTERPFAAILLA